MQWLRVWLLAWRRHRDRDRQDGLTVGSAPVAAIAAIDRAAAVPPSADQPLERARQAEQRADWAAAERHWRSAIVRDETLAAAHTGLATALRRQGRLAEAEAVLLNAQTLLPPDPEHFQGYAEMAEMRGDWTAAEHRWRTMRERFPVVWYSYIGGATALRELGRPDEAAELLSNAAPRFAWEPAFPLELARLAASRANWPAAEGHWRAALTFDGRPWWVYGELAVALEQQGQLAEAEAVLLDGQAKDPGEIRLLISHARLADGRQDRPEAERRWRIVRERFPDRPEGYSSHAEALRHLRRFDDAEAVLREARSLFPAEGAIHQGLARLAEARSDWVAAAEYWRHSLTIDADASWARAALATALVRLGSPDQAEALLLARQHSHPNEIACFIAFAQLPEARQDWETAEARWQVVLRTFPDRPEGYEGVIRSSREGRLPVDAAAVVAEGLRRFPTREGILLEAARLAQHAGNSDNALQILALVRLHFPRLVAAYTEAADILRTMRRFDEAQALLTEAKTFFPDHEMVWRGVGLLTEARDDWVAAVTHWAEMDRRFPAAGDRSIRLHGALLRLAETDPAAADTAVREQGLATPDDVLRSLALCFESLGGCGPAGGCEFGFVQRACGAEPLGLLRWAFVAPERLIACLGDRFEGIGNPETTEIYLENDNPDGSWDVRDTRGGIALHTFVPAKEVPYERMAVLTQKRLRYLRDKLIADLENPTKMFVLNASDRHLTQAELEDLGRGIRSYGPGELLCVFAADADHAPGEVEVRAPGVRVGYLDFSGLKNYGPRTPAWLALCRTVRAE